MNRKEGRARVALPEQLALELPVAPLEVASDASVSTTVRARASQAAVRGHEDAHVPRALAKVQKIQLFGSVLQ